MTGQLSFRWRIQVAAFQRKSRNLFSNVQGTGLGLSICRLIVTFVGGKIWIDGDYTQGARFCFTHPLKYKSTLL